MNRRRRLLWAVQLVLAAAVAGFVARAVARHWAEFRALDFPVDLRAGWIALAALIVMATYGVLIAAWRLVLQGWGERLAPAPAVAIWTLSNLGRYLPGKVWGVAGLAVLAQRAGVAAWAGVGAAVAMQALAVGSGVAVTAATAPGVLSPTGLAAGVGIAGLTLLVLATPAAMARLGRLARREDLRPLRPATVILAGAVTTVSWMGYGLAFWCLARGTLGGATPSMAAATGVFAAGYVAGLLALFAPGGVGVREAMLVALLAPGIGSGGAIVLSVASRILLTLTEAAAAAAGAWLGRGLLAPASPTGPAHGAPD